MRLNNKNVLLQFNSKIFMKKLKRQRSMTSKVKQTKQIFECKTPIPTSKKNLHQKKITQWQKQNKSLLHEPVQIPKPSKKINNIKSKQRSKSLLYDHGKLASNPTPPPKRNILMETLQKRAIQKSETDISGHLQSIRFQKQYLDFDKVYSNFLSPHPKFESQVEVEFQIQQPQDMTPKLKQLQQQNQTLLTNLSAIKQQMNNYVKENEIKRVQNRQLKQKITDFQSEIRAQIQKSKLKEIQLCKIHALEKQEFQKKTYELEFQRQKLLSEKQTLQILVKNQQCNILQLQAQKKQLQVKYQEQQKQKKSLERQKQSAFFRIQCLQQELKLFQSNLHQFQQIKETYELRLSELQKQKQKIKKNAFQLLQMVQSYRQL